VPAKKVPILKFIDDESGFQVDFNVNNLLGIINSNLIFTYVQIDHRFHIMNVFLKWWAKSVGILGASNGYLSSYALTLMIIAFL
jgi:DNA polymerase sigma